MFFTERTKRFFYKPKRSSEAIFTSLLRFMMHLAGGNLPPVYNGEAHSQRHKSGPPGGEPLLHIWRNR